MKAQTLTLPNEGPGRDLLEVTLPDDGFDTDLA